MNDGGKNNRKTLLNKNTKTFQKHQFQSKISFIVGNQKMGCKN